MAEPISNGSKFPTQPKPNLDLFFAVPAVRTEGMSDEDWAAELSRMFHHSRLTRQFVDGHISPDDFEDGLADLGMNPYELADLWEEGVSLLL